MVYTQRVENGRIVTRWVGPGGPEVVYPGPYGGNAYEAVAIKGGHWQTKGQRAYDGARGIRRQPIVDESQEDAPMSLPLVADALQQLINETLWRREEVQEVLTTLQTCRPQIIVAGPPGTGKAWVAETFAKFITGDAEDAVRLVQFHPATPARTSSRACARWSATDRSHSRWSPGR